MPSLRSPVDQAPYLARRYPENVLRLLCQSGGGLHGLPPYPHDQGERNPAPLARDAVDESDAERCEDGDPMTLQTPQQWIESADLIQCNKYHARITTAACEAFQDRHDSSEMGNWKHGEFSKYPHPCKGCENFREKADRSLVLKSRRIAPSLPIPTGQTHIRPRVTVICPRCREKREVTVDRTMQPSFIASRGMCRSCSRREKNKNKPPRLSPTRKVDVVCPVCGKARQVSYHYTKREGFTGRCATCATIATNKTRGVSRDDWKKKIDVTCPGCDSVRQVQYGFTVRPDFTGFCAKCAQLNKRKKSYKKDWGKHDK